MQAVDAGQNISLKTETDEGNITNSGVLTAKETVSLNAVTSGNINVNNQINGKDIEIQTANGKIENNAAGTLTATAEGGTITVGATQGNIVLGGAATADQKVKIDANAGSATLNGAVRSVNSEVEVTAQGVVTTNAAVQAGMDVSLLSKNAAVSVNDGRKR